MWELSRLKGGELDLGFRFGTGWSEWIRKEELAEYTVDNPLLTRVNVPHRHKHSEREFLTKQQKLTRKEKHGVLRRSYCRIVGNPISSPCHSVEKSMCVCSWSCEFCVFQRAAGTLVIQYLQQSIVGLHVWVHL